MPKAEVVCRHCNWTAEGDVPDGKYVGWHYHLADHGSPMNPLGAAIMNHHIDTRPKRTFFGHSDFNVFLEDGRRGVVEANSYCVIYTERDGSDE